MSIIGIENDTAVEINAGKYPMESVFKFHIALAVLHEVDRGNLSMDQMIVITKDELSEKTESDKGQISERDKASSSEVLKATVGQSDNIGCDVLLEAHRRPRKSNRLHPQPRHKGYSNRRHGAADAREVGYAVSELDNAAGIFSAAEKFYTEKILSGKSFAFLLSLLSDTKTGAKTSSCRPACRNAFAHKTGTSAVINGITGGVNDIGIVTLPDGRHYAISVFVADSRESMETNEKIIADISKAAWTFLRLRSERTGKRIVTHQK